MHKTFYYRKAAVWCILSLGYGIRVGDVTKDSGASSLKHISSGYLIGLVSGYRRTGSIWEHESCSARWRTQILAFFHGFVVLTVHLPHTRSNIWLHTSKSVNANVPRSEVSQTTGTPLLLLLFLHLSSYNIKLCWTF